MTERKRLSSRESSSIEKDPKILVEFINLGFAAQTESQYCEWCVDRLAGGDQGLCNYCLAHAINQRSASRIMALLRSAPPRG